MEDRSQRLNNTIKAVADILKKIKIMNLQKKHMKVF